MTRFLLQGTFAFVLAVLTVAGPSVTPARAGDTAPSSNNAVLAPDIEMGALDPEHGFFVTSQNTTTAGLHGIPNRKFIVARAPDASRLQALSNEFKDTQGKKHGQQYFKYSAGKIEVSYYVHGARISTACYDNHGRPYLSFENFDPATGKKQGLQYFFYASGDCDVSVYQDGIRTMSGRYDKDGKPYLAFDTYDNEGKKHGNSYFVYSSGDWEFSQFTHGNRQGAAARYSNSARAVNPGTPTAWRIPDDRTSATTMPSASSTPSASAPPHNTGGAASPSTPASQPRSSGSTSNSGSGLTTSILKER